MKTKIQSVIEFTGLDYLPYAFGRKHFDEQPMDGELKLSYKKILKDISKIESEEKIEDSISEYKEIFNQEESRGEKIETKAFNLIGIISIATAFITGFTSLVPDNTPILLIIFITAAYIFIVFAMTITVLLGARAVVTGRFFYSTPQGTDLGKLPSLSQMDIKRERLANYYYSSKHNYQVHSNKASYLIGAQLWFRNVVFLFLLLAILLVCLIPMKVGFLSAASLQVTPTNASNLMLTATPTHDFQILSPSPTLETPTVPLTPQITPILPLTLKTVVPSVYPIIATTQIP